MKLQDFRDKIPQLNGLDDDSALAVLHNGGAALLVLLLVVLNYRLSLSGRECSTEPRSSLSPV